MPTNPLMRDLIAVILLVAPLGCAAEQWNLDRYRDERAIDIENRLSREESVVKNPFGNTNAN